MAARVLTVQAIDRLKPDAARRLEIPDATLPGLYFIIQHPARKAGRCGIGTMAAPES